MRTSKVRAFIDDVSDPWESIVRLEVPTGFKVVKAVVWHGDTLSIPAEGVIFVKLLYLEDSFVDNITRLVVQRVDDFEVVRQQIDIEAEKEDWETLVNAIEETGLVVPFSKEERSGGEKVL